MKILHSISFSKQLIIYLLIVLFIAFIFISLALTNSVQQFIGSNAYIQAQTFAGNIQNVFEKEIRKIESIPDKIINLEGKTVLQCTSNLPEMLMKSYSQLACCSIHYISKDSTSASNPQIVAIRRSNGEVEIEHSQEKPSFRPPDPKEIIHQNSQGGLWIYSEVNSVKTMAFCYPLCDCHNQCHGYLKLDFPMKVITDIICSYKLYEYGNLFILDSLGNYIVTPFQEENNKDSQHNYFTEESNNALQNAIQKGGISSTVYYDNNTKYFIYYSPLSHMHWRLGIICPYNEILNSSHKLYWVIFLCLGGGLLFLFVGVIKIVHRLSFPLKQLAFTARQIADGHFDVKVPVLKSSSEINELYDSFRYMQQSIINYIEKLKISTAEKEQRKSEMCLARRIQQRFLPQHIDLPSNIELAAELRQSQEVGGDLYEFFILDNRLYFAIGDVSGKGTPAALYMVSISKLFRYIASSHTSTATICNIINKHMCEDTEDDMYVTIFMGILDINTGTLTYTNAGHPYPLIIHENGETNFLSRYPEAPVGVLSDHVFTEHTYTLHKNTSMLFYTDGITDAENTAGEFYSSENLVKRVEEVAQRSPQQIIQAILEEIKIHIGQRNQSDDLTVLLLRYNGVPTDHFPSSVDTSCK